jgi:hypothetical protein
LKLRARIRGGWIGGNLSIVGDNQQANGGEEGTLPSQHDFQFKINNTMILRRYHLDFVTQAVTQRA